MEMLACIVFSRWTFTNCVVLAMFGYTIPINPSFFFFFGNVVIDQENLFFHVTICIKNLDVKEWFQNVAENQKIPNF